MIGLELEKLLALQAVDVALDDVARREAAARARLNESQRALETFREEVKAEKKLLDEALKQHKAIELEIKQKEEMTRKYSTQMYEVKTNKEYVALKDEIEKAKGEAALLEDRLLGLMLKEDELKSAQVKRNEELKVREAGAKQAEAEAAAESARCTEARASLDGQRAERQSSMGKPLLHRYDQIRRARGGAPLARIELAPGGGEAVCGECHMTVRPQIVVQAARAEELVFCESCARILYLEVEKAAHPA